MDFVACVNCTLTTGTSSSAMLTVASFGLPELTPVGSVPNPSFTLSSSSSTVSWVAEKLRVLKVSPELKVRLAGTPE